MDKFEKLHKLYKVASVFVFVLASTACGLVTGGTIVKVILSFIWTPHHHGLASGLMHLFVGALFGALMGLGSAIVFIADRKTTKNLFKYSGWATLIAVANVLLTMFLVHVVGVSW